MPVTRRIARVAGISLTAYLAAAGNATAANEQGSPRPAASEPRSQPVPPTPDPAAVDLPQPGARGTGHTVPPDPAQDSDPSTQPEAQAPAGGDGVTEAAAAATVHRAQSRGEASPSGRDGEAARAQGTCRTPREAWLQLLYWLQKGSRWQPAKASQCLDTSRLVDPDHAPRLAEQLKEIVDARSARVDIARVPDDPNYLDDNGLPAYEEPNVESKIPGIRVVKRGDRWLFAPGTLAKVPELYPSLTAELERILPAWTTRVLIGIQVWQWLGVVLLVFVALVTQRLTVFVIGSYFHHMVGREQRYLTMAVKRASRPIGGLTMALVFYVGFPLLLFPLRLSELAFMATKALAAFSSVWLGYRLIDVLSQFMAAKAGRSESKLDDQLVPLVTKTLKVFVSVIGAIFILQNLNVDVGSLLAGLGLGGLAFALAAKDTLANFFGSVMIFVDKPFQIGDWVVIGGTEGIVEEVGFRTSRVRTFYNSVVTVPNASVVNSMVDNYGARRYRRYVANLGLTYDTPAEKVQAFCEGVRAIIAAMPAMRKDYYLVEFKEFGDSGLIVMVYCFMVAQSWNDELRTRSYLNLEILRLAEKLGVSFAFPTRTLHVETLAQPGTKSPDRGGPRTEAELAAIVEQFGPGGSLGRPKGINLSKGYDCGVDWTQSGPGKGSRGDV